MSPRLYDLRILIFALGLLAAPIVVRATDAPHEKLTKVESELAEQKKRAAELDQQRKETASNLTELRQQLIDATSALADKQDEAQQVEDRLHHLEGEIQARNDALGKSRHELSTLIGVLIRLGEQPPETYFLKAGLTNDHIHRAILARSLLPRLQADTESAARDLVVLADLHWMAQEQRRLVTASQQNLRGQQANLDQLVRTRQGLLSRTESQKATIAKQLASLTTEARDLRQLMLKVEPPGYRPKAGPRPTLEKPVSGSVVRNYGSKDADGITSHGLTFAARAGSPVIAPLAGRVVFAGPFRGYGQILILQHKGGYHSFLAGFGRIDAEMGQEVVAGEPLGILPFNDKSGRPELYFEWRRNGEPVDPMEQKFRTKAAAP